MIAKIYVLALYTDGNANPPNYFADPFLLVTSIKPPGVLDVTLVCHGSSRVSATKSMFVILQHDDTMSN
jgi:hypothetical protein